LSDRHISRQILLFQTIAAAPSHNGKPLVSELCEDLRKGQNDLRIEGRNERKSIGDRGGGSFWDEVTVDYIAAICALRIEISFRSSMKSVESCSTTGSFNFSAICVFRAETSSESV
jgi:hypothetical protein